MAINLELYLPSSYTTTVQLYARVGGAAVGSPVAGVPDGGDPTLYVFALGTPAIGDYDVQLSGVSTPNGPKFPMRVTSTTQYYLADYWYLIDATIVTPAPIPPAIAGLCNVLFSVRDSEGTPVEKASIYATVEPNSAVPGNIIATDERGHTATNGQLLLTLVRYVQFTSGGAYTFRVTDRKGSLLWSKRVHIPDAATAFAEEIPAI